MASSRIAPRIRLALLGALAAAWGCQSFLDFAGDVPLVAGDAGELHASSPLEPDAARAALGAPTLIVAAGDADFLAMDPLDVYWVGKSSDSILHASRSRTDGGVDQGTVLRAGIRATGNICVGPHGVYVPFNRNSSLAVLRIPRQGGEPQGLGWGDALYPKALLLVGATLFATDYSTIGSITDMGVAPRILASLPTVHMAADDSDLFFGSGASIMRMSRSGADAGLKVIVDSVGPLRGLAVDANYVYWIEDSGSVFAFAKDVDGGAPQLLASKQQGPSSLALDKASVYWTNAGGGTVVGMAKPPAPGAPQPPDLSIVVIATEQVTPSNVVADERGIAWISGAGDIMAAHRR